MNVSEVVVGYLAAAGVRHIFGYPGDPSVEFLECARRAGMQFVLGSREGTSGLMACAYGQLMGRPGVCLSTLGPGATNLVNAVASAKLDRTPMLAISGQIETKREPTFTHQVVDHTLLFSSVSKWTVAVQPHTVGTIMRKALRTAMAERPGPVHLTTAADVVAATATDDAIRLPPLRSERAAQVFVSEPGTDPVRRVREARRPVIVAGLSAVQAEAGDAVRLLAEKLGCPVVLSPMAKGLLPEEHALFAGTLDMACNAFVWDFLRGADLLLTIGFDAVELIKPWSLTAPALHIDSVPNTDQIVPAEIELVGDIAVLCEGLAAALGAIEPRWREADIAAHRAELRARYAAGRVAGRLNPSDVVDVVRAAMPRDTIVSTDVGSHKLLVGQGWTTHAPRTLLTSNGLSSMGFGLPAAMVAKLLHPKREVVSFTGDGGLAMVQGELGIAAGLKLGLVVVVFCDDSLNRIELKQAARGYPAWGTRMLPTDIERLAQSMGCDGVAVDSAAALEAALSQARANPARTRPLVIGARIDPAQYVAQF
ncbi:MAG: thiamine pyrophosphate-binding protein [Rubrivivax sp.]|nr:thiamine pyrophosphate-binding protein [Rubrivivax sp.]